MSTVGRRQPGVMFFVLALTLLGYLTVYLAFLDRGGLGTMTVTETVRGVESVRVYDLDQFSVNLWMLLLPAAFVVLTAGVQALIRRRLPGADPFLFPMAAFLTGFGLIVLYRLAPDIARIQANSSLRLLALRQFLWIGVGYAALAAVILFVGERQLENLGRRKYLFVVAGALLIVATGLFGVELNGRRLWLKIGPLTLQTVEIVKMLMVFFVAAYFHHEGRYVATRRVAGVEFPGLRSIGPFLVMALLAVLPVFFQKDLGPTLLLALTFIAMFYVGTGLWSVPVFGSALFASLAALAYAAGTPSIIRTRIDMWVSPFTHGEAIVSSLWAISSGGLFGLGLGRGLPAYIPVVQSDFNFAAICEETGFAGAVAVVAVYALILYRGYRIAVAARSTYRRLLAAGLMTLFALQAVMILYGVSGMMPMTGITLPFISYGGTSLVVSFVLVGLMLRISAREGTDD